MDVLLSVKDVTKVYSKNKKPSLNHVSFEVNSGEFVGIMGASGSGKTTLLNVLSTIDSVNSGEIVINGVNLKELNNNSTADFIKDNIGFIFQEYFLIDSLNVFENIAVPLTLKHMQPSEIEDSIKLLTKRFGIDSTLYKYPNELSGGQCQRVAAARAIIKKPSIILADEPTGALDSVSANELLKTLSDVNQELKTTILMVTHDAYVASFCDRILIFRDGQIIDELKKNEKNHKDFFETIVSKTTKLEAIY